MSSCEEYSKSCKLKFLALDQGNVTNLSGNIKLEPPPVKTSDEQSVVRITIEDSAIAGDISPAIKHMEYFSVNRLCDKIPYQLSCSDLTNDGIYNVRVHIDVNRSGSITVNDYLSTKAHIIPQVNCYLTMDINVEKVA